MPGAERDPRRLLIVRLGAFGDVVRTLPAAWALRRRLPGAHLAWLVEPGAAALLERLPWLDDVIVLPRPALEQALAGRRVGALARGVAEVRRTLRSQGFDCVVDFHGILKSALLARATGAPRRVGLAGPEGREGASAFYTERVASPSGARSRWLRNAALARHLGATPDGVPIPGLASDGRTDAGGAPAASGGAPVASGGAPAASRGAHAVLHPGTSPGTPHKRYPVTRFAEVARALARELGAPCVVTCGGGDEERALVRVLEGHAGDAVRVVSTGRDVGALVDALAAARVVVSGDTGPLHLASLLGTPVVQILGPTHPVQNEPWPGTPWARAQLPTPCSPCRRGCPEAPCLALLPPADVIAAVRRVLAEAEAEGAEAEGEGAEARPSEGIAARPSESMGAPRTEDVDVPASASRPEADLATGASPGVRGAGARARGAVGVRA